MPAEMVRLPIFTKQMSKFETESLSIITTKRISTKQDVDETSLPPMQSYEDLRGARDAQSAALFNPFKDFSVHAFFFSGVFILH